jgi:hypothetical protein
MYQCHKVDQDPQALDCFVEEEHFIRVKVGELCYDSGRADTAGSVQVTSRPPTISVTAGIFCLRGEITLISRLKIEPQ